MFLKHAPEEVIIEKISYKGGSPGAVCVALQNTCLVAVALSLGLNPWAVSLSQPR